MLFDKAQNMATYYESAPRLEFCVEFLKRFEEEALPDGEYEIDGERVFANIQTYRTKQQDDTCRFEAHRKYVDVQYIVSGMEKIRVAKLGDLKLTEERSSKGQDIAFYEGEPRLDFVLTKGTFLMLYPQDAHMPGLSVEKDSTVRKIIFKLAVPFSGRNIS